MSTDKNEITFTGIGKVVRFDTIQTKSGKDMGVLVVETDGKYPQLVPIKVFGQLAEMSKKHKPGTRVAVSGRLGGREWSGKIYGDNVAEVVDPLDVSDPLGEPSSQPASDDDIPF